MVFDTLSSLFGSVPSDVVVDSISSGIPSKLLGTSLAYSRRIPLLRSNSGFLRGVQIIGELIDGTLKFASVV